MPPKGPEKNIYTHLENGVKRRVGAAIIAALLITAYSAASEGVSKTDGPLIPPTTAQLEEDSKSGNDTEDESVWEKLGGFVPEEIDTSDMNDCELAENEIKQYVDEQTHYWGSAARVLGLHCVGEEVQTDHRA